MSGSDFSDLRSKCGYFAYWLSSVYTQYTPHTSARRIIIFSTSYLHIIKFSNTPLICYWLVQQVTQPQTHTIGWISSSQSCFGYLFTFLSLTLAVWSNGVSTYHTGIEGQVEQVAMWDIVFNTDSSVVYCNFCTMYHVLKIVHNIRNSHIVIGILQY